MWTSHAPRLASSPGASPPNLAREAKASIVLTLVTLAVVLTISLVGLALS